MLEGYKSAMERSLFSNATTLSISSVTYVLFIFHSVKYCLSLKI